MRAGLLLPICMLLSAIAHILLVAAVAVPRHALTAHGETIDVDIVPASEVPHLPDVPETTPSPDIPTPSAEAPGGAEQSLPPQNSSQGTQSRGTGQTQRPSANPSTQRPASQQAQRRSVPPPPPEQKADPEPPKSELPQSEASQTEPAPGDTLAEQNERLAAMLNLPGPNTGDGTGAEADHSAQLTPQEIAAFRAHLRSCWKLPSGVGPEQRLKVVVRMSLRQNGTLASDPTLIEAGASVMGPPLVQAAIRAIKQCAPYSMLPSAKYREWRVLDINFSPDEMAKG